MSRAGSFLLSKGALSKSCLSNSLRSKPIGELYIAADERTFVTDLPLWPRRQGALTWVLPLLWFAQPVASQPQRWLQRT